MAAEKAFPSPCELEVASSLLLLSTTVPGHLALISLKSENSYKKKKKKMMIMRKKSSTRLSVSRSNLSGASSSITSDNEQGVKVITMATEFHDMVKLKVVRKPRSKTFCISDCRKINSRLPKTKVETSASASSSLSSNSGSAISSARSREKPKTFLGSGYMRRRAEAILKVLTAHGSVSEVRIRQLLGDSPSTSKALRILLNLEQVKRTGAGGRSDPYIYTIA